jgi:hypothetical protein
MSQSSLALECSLEEGYAADNAAQLINMGNLAEGSLRQIQKFEKLLNSKNWEDGKPMSQQMDAKEASEFGEHKKLQEIMLMKQLTESKRERDIQVIRRLGTLADKVYRYGLVDTIKTNQDAKDQLLIQILIRSREIISVKLDDINIPSDKVCNLENALKNIAQTTASEAVSVKDLDAVMEELNLLARKYGAPIDPEKLNDSQRKRFFTYLEPKIRKAQTLLQQAEDVYRLSMLEGVSKKMLAARRQDQFDSPGDLDYSGTTWDRWKQEGRVTEHEHRLTGILNFINENIPSSVINGWNESRK